MRTDSHTPGPWHVETVSDRDRVLVRTTEVASMVLADCGLSGNKVAIANGNLIAAAPELLEVLKDAIKECRCTLAERDSGHLVECFVPHAKEVIAKAENRHAH